MTDSTAKRTPEGRFRRIVARLGVVGILFFFIKGLLWLTIPALLAWGFTD